MTVWDKICQKIPTSFIIIVAHLGPAVLYRIQLSPIHANNFRLYADLQQPIAMFANKLFLSFYLQNPIVKFQFFPKKIKVQNNFK